MHVMFLHQNCPGQFGPIISRLQKLTDWTFSFCHRNDAVMPSGVTGIRYAHQGGATKRTHFYTRSMENIAAQSSGLMHAVSARPDIRPDLIVAHSGFVSYLPLLERFHCPVISYLEYFYHTKNSDIDFRPEQQPSIEERTRARFRNAPLLMDLDAATAGLSPTHWQRDRFPELLRPKIDVIFDGIDTSIWHRRAGTTRNVGRIVIPHDVELVTYAARGFESMRGFDIFMTFAQALLAKRPHVRFLVVGSDRICYSGDEKRTGGKSFREWVLSKDHYDLTKFVFLKPMPPTQLAELFSITDLHVYLTVPFVLSWSLLNAMACAAPILASGTDPVKEVITHDEHGRLADFFDIDGLVNNAVDLLSNRDHAKKLGERAKRRIVERYTLDVTAPQHKALFERVAAR